MKQGRKPNRRQAVLISKANLLPSEWLIVKNLPKELHIINRFTDKTKVIPLMD